MVHSIAKMLCFAWNFAWTRKRTNDRSNLFTCWENIQRLKSFRSYSFKLIFYEFHLWSFIKDLALFYSVHKSKFPPSWTFLDLLEMFIAGLAFYLLFVFENTVARKMSQHNSLLINIKSSLLYRLESFVWKLFKNNYFKGVLPVIWNIFLELQK